MKIRKILKCIIFLSLLAGEHEAYGEVYSFPSSCGQKYYNDMAIENCWIGFVCKLPYDLTDPKVNITFHCPREKKMYMNIGKDKKFTRVTSVVTKTDELLFTTINKSSSSSSIVSVKKQDMTEVEVLNSKSGNYYYDGKSFLLLSLDECSKMSFKLFNKCYKSIVVENIK